MFSRLFKSSILSGVALAALGMSPAHASLLGGTFDFQYYAYGGQYSGGGSPTTFTATGTPGAQFFDYFTVTVNSNQIIYNYLSDTTWASSGPSLNSSGLYSDNGSVISAVSGVPAITSVTIDPSSVLGSSGFNASNVTWNSGAVATAWANEDFSAGDTVVLDVNVSPVPLPGSVGMFGSALLGLVGLTGARRKFVAPLGS